MKQHITSDQLNELTPEQRETIARILKGYPLSIAPRLSIGQCIELLGWKLDKIEYDGFVNYYYVTVREIGSWGEPELIDALWEAVKCVLREEAHNEPQNKF